ncbi:MAG: Nramp family divalent metal transporter, partial [Planctomycetes bacterium]|nr:Nramp family divalent metal transporter [Planctomycetota bacterium]
TRWQLATGDTLLEFCVTHFGRPFQWAFLVYLLLWSFLVGLALMSACGAVVHAGFPLSTPKTDLIVYGILHSIVAVILVKLGGYRLFEKVMTACIVAMFIIVIATAVAVHPPVGEIVSGLLVPSIPKLNDGGLSWTIALLGGVGGTLTVLCYGYWIREEGRQSIKDLRICRIDLATAYAMTALFGMSMLVIGSRIDKIEGGGSKLLVNLADGLQGEFGEFGPVVKWAFLIGAWGAIFSSLLGVWQAIPYLFTDFWNMVTDRNDNQAKPQGKQKVDTRSRAYCGYLYGLATVPAIGLWTVSFETAQKTYAVIGALVIPFLSIILLYLNNRTDLVGKEYRNTWKTNTILAVTLLLFLFAGWMAIQAKFAS